MAFSITSTDIINGSVEAIFGSAGVEREISSGAELVSGAVAVNSTSADAAVAG
jgi:hypothetical protein